MLSLQISQILNYFITRVLASSFLASSHFDVCIVITMYFLISTQSRYYNFILLETDDLSTRFYSFLSDET